MAMSELFTGSFWLATLERAIRSFAASLSSILAADGTDLLNTAWGQKASIAGMAAVVTILLAIAGGTAGSGPGPSLLGFETTDDRG